MSGGFLRAGYFQDRTKNLEAEVQSLWRDRTCFPHADGGYLKSTSFDAILYLVNLWRRLFVKTTFVVFLLMIALIPGNAQSRQEIAVQPSLSKAQDLAQWDLDGSGTWEIAAGKLILSKAGIPSGPIRRPAALAILKTKPFRKATIEAELLSTAAPDVARRDLDLIVGYESPTRFYYIHLSATSDPVHNGIFLVNNADRKRIDSVTGKPLLTEFSWRRVRVERDGQTGHIAVFMNGSRSPALQATDTTIARGRVGVGSFDDTGEFRNIIAKGSTK
jgi:hypothetical protein